MAANEKGIDSRLIERLSIGLIGVLLTVVSFFSVNMYRGIASEVQDHEERIRRNEKVIIENTNSVSSLVEINTIIVNGLRKDLERLEKKIDILSNQINENSKD